MGVASIESSESSESRERREAAEEALPRIATALEKLLALVAKGFAREIETSAKREADEVRRMAE